MTSNSISMHWGSSKKVAQAPAKAVAAARTIAGFSGTLAQWAHPKLLVAVGTGKSFFGVIETACSRFFVVGGGDIPAVKQLIDQDFSQAVGAKVLVTQPVCDAVRYTFVCHPRLVLSHSVAWEPVQEIAERRDDEWMYQLQQQEPDALDPGQLAAPFAAVAKGQYAEALAQIAVVCAQKERLRGNDLQALEHLKGLAQRLAKSA